MLTAMKCGWGSGSETSRLEVVVGVGVGFLMLMNISKRCFMMETEIDTQLETLTRLN